MATRPIILPDDGGVMNDSRLRGPQWQRLVGEFFTPRLGGIAETAPLIYHIEGTRKR